MLGTGSSGGDAKRKKKVTANRNDADSRIRSRWMKGETESISAVKLPLVSHLYTYRDMYRDDSNIYILWGADGQSESTYVSVNMAIAVP